MDLPDINLWLAVIDENHSLHAGAVDYWEKNPGTKKAFCRVTMMGFLRIGTVPGVLHGPLSNPEIWDIYHQFLKHPHHLYLDEPTGLQNQFYNLTTVPHFPHRLWTDAYLAAFALAGGCRLVSFDADFTRFPGLNFLHLSA